MADSEKKAKKSKEKKKAGELFQYDAFISYRHCDPDKAVAEELHKQLEAYNMPKNVETQLKNGHTKIERVFRDEEELPIASNLENSIVKALENSEWLIVICSPRLIESQWCRLEIKTFIELHGRDHVLAVLVEGEPNESFPPELVYDNIEYVDPDGTIKVEQKYIEPLAADIRGKNKKEILKNISSQKLRLIAAMFNLNYDDLKQRHREKAIRRRLGIMGIVSVIALLIGAISFVMMLRINSQKKQIEKQNQEIVAQAAEIDNQNKALLSSQARAQAALSLSYLADGDRLKAVETAYDALTEMDGIEMPYTGEAEYALASALYTYNVDGQLEPFVSRDMPGQIRDIEVSPEGSYVYALDSANNLYIWNAENMSLIKNFEGVCNPAYDRHGALFLDDNRLLIVKQDAFYGEDTLGTTYVYDCSNDSITKLVNPYTDDDITISFGDDYVMTTADGQYIGVFAEFDYLNIYSSDDYELVDTILFDDLTPMALSSVAVEDEIVEEDGEEVDEDTEETTDEVENLDLPDSIDAGVTNVDQAFMSDGYIILSVIGSDTNYYLRVYDMETMELVGNYPMGYELVYRARIVDGVLYYSRFDWGNLTNIVTHVGAIDLNTNAVIWESAVNSGLNEMYYILVNDEPYILIEAYSGLYWLDVTTGEECGVYSTFEDVVGLYLYPEGVRVVTADNIAAYVPGTDGTFYDSYGMYLTGSDEDSFSALDINYYQNGTVFASPKSSNSVVMYRQVSCPGLSPLESGTNAVGVSFAEGGSYMSEPPCETYYYSNGTASETILNEVSEIADQFGIEDLSTIESLVVADDDSYVVVNRSDKTFDIYNSEGTHLGNYSFPLRTAVESFLGADSHGNIYVTDYIGWNGYRISSDGVVLALVYQMVGFDFDNDCVIRDIDGICMTQPIYELDELKAMAETVLGI